MALLKLTNIGTNGFLSLNTSVVSSVYWRLCKSSWTDLKLNTEQQKISYEHRCKRWWKSILSFGAARHPQWCRWEWQLVSNKCKEGPNQRLTNTLQEDKGNPLRVCILIVHEELLGNRLGKQRGQEVTIVAWRMKAASNRFIRPPAVGARLMLSLQLHKPNDLQHPGCRCRRNTMYHCLLVGCASGCFLAASALLCSSLCPWGKHVFAQGCCLYEEEQLMNSFSYVSITFLPCSRRGFAPRASGEQTSLCTA